MFIINTTTMFTSMEVTPPLTWIPIGMTLIGTILRICGGVRLITGALTTGITRFTVIRIFGRATAIMAAGDISIRTGHIMMGQALIPSMRVAAAADM